MKNRLGFLLPRIIGFTLLIGVASLVLGLIFKLLIGAIVFGAIALGIVGIIHFFKQHQRRPGIHNHKTRNMYRNSYSERATIVPIN